MAGRRYESKAFELRGKKRKEFEAYQSGEKGTGPEVRVIFKDASRKWRGVELTLPAKLAVWHRFDSTDHARRWAASGYIEPAIEL
jgi:hypothetical protein